MTGILLIGILVLLLLQVLEIRRRLRDPIVLTPAQFWRRLLTAGILQIVLVMWLVGERVMDQQPPLTRLAYWSAALFLALAAAAAAVREMAEVTRSYNRIRAEMFRGDGPPDAEPGPPQSSNGAGHPRPRAPG